MKNILLVEDDPFLLDIYTTKLKEENFNTIVATDGDDCLRKLRDVNLRPDLILLDIVLPNLDGWEILKRLKTNDKLKDIKVVILSNLGQRGEVEKGINLGAEKYLIKAHFTPGEIVSEIKKILI